MADYDFYKWERFALVQRPDTEVAVVDLYKEVKNYEDEPRMTTEPEWATASGLEELGGGVKVGVTVQMDNARVGFEPNNSSVSSGTATSADSNGERLEDTAATFQTDSVAVGATVINLDDGSVGTIIAIDSQTVVRHLPLEDGTNNDWGIGDNYKIWNIDQCTIAGGNLTYLGGAPNDAIIPTAFTQVVMTAASSATLQEQAALQYSSYNGGVTVDAGSSYTGIDYPVGTPQEPVNNLADALDIAADKGFTVFYVLGDITIDSGLNFTQMSFVGESIDKSEFTIDSDADVTQCEFYEATIQGTLDGQCKIKDCNILDVNYISGVVELCIISGDILLGGGATAYFLDCWAGTHLDAPPAIDCGGSGQTLVMQNFNGYIKWKNLTGANDQANASLNAGWVLLDSTITAGQVTIIGVGTVDDYSNGATVNIEHLVNPNNIRDHVWADSRAQLLYNMEGGRWKVDTITNQMIFYRADNTTEVARFNLFDSTGAPASENVYERRRVTTTTTTTTTTSTTSTTTS